MYFYEIASHILNRVRQYPSPQLPVSKYLLFPDYLKHLPEGSDDMQDAGGINDTLSSHVLLYSHFIDSVALALKFYTCSKLDAIVLLIMHDTVIDVIICVCFILSCPWFGYHSCSPFK